jgi:hypothetical protein
MSAFADTPSDWALESTLWAVATELLQGKGSGLLEPQGGTKRCGCAALLQRFMEKYA